MVACGWHGREWATAELCRDWQQRFASAKPSCAVDWLVIPEVNPDGIEAARSGKNPCQRCNARGVDLNRNFPPPERCPASVPPIRMTEQEARQLGPWNETYPGERPLSEIESQRIAEAARQFDPDVLLLVHSGGDLISLPYDSCWSADEDPLYKRQLILGRWMARMVNISRERVWPGQSVLYAALGTFGDYARAFLDVPFVYTLETYETSEAALLKRSTAALSNEECPRYFNPPDVRAYLARWGAVAEAFAHLDQDSSARLVRWSDRPEEED